MDSNKQHQEASLIGLLLSLEALLTLMGVASLIYGVINAIPLNIILGLLIVPGLLLVARARRERRRRKP
jgi:Flp pilus assembly protein TadB